MYLLNGSEIDVLKQHVIDGVLYNDLYVPERQSQLGIVFVPDPETPPVVPKITQVSMRQARLALLSMGKLAVVNAAVPSMGEAAQIEWEYATTVDRDSPLTSAMIGLLGLSDAEADALFLSASEL